MIPNLSGNTVRGSVVISLIDDLHSVEIVIYGFAKEFLLNT